MTNEPLAVTALVQVASTLQRANGRLADLAHVTDLISSYLDTTISLTPPQAVRRGSHRLFQRVVTRVTIDPSVDPVFRAHWLARALEAAIEKDDLVLVQQIHKWHPTPLNAKSLKYAFKFGSLQLVLWIIHNRHDRRCCEPGLKNLCRACLLAALPASSFQGPDAGSVIEWLLCQGVDLVHLSGAARNLSTLSWLDAHDHLESLDPSSQLAKMIREGYDRHVDVVRYLIDHGASLSEERLIISLIRSSCQRKAEPMVDVVVASQLCDSLRDKFVWAPTRPDGVKVLQWDATFMAEKTLQGSVPMSHTITYFASKFCHVDTLAWLVEERGVRLTSSTNRKPRREKDLLSLYQWMLDTGVRDFQGWRLGDAYCSARKGYIRTVQWLHEHKPALFYPHTMDTAAENGHLSIVQWLHENRNEGCTPNALVLAAKNGHLDIVQWLSANKTEGSTNDAMVAAAVGGHLEVLAWLHANRADSCNACVLTAVLRHDKCANKTMDPIRWLTAHNSRAGSCIGHCVQDPLRRTAAFSVAATLMKRGDVNSARYLLEHHRDAFKIESLERMTRGSHLPALKWLYAAAPDLVDWQHALQVAGESETLEIAEWLELMQK